MEVASGLGNDMYSSHYGSGTEPSSLFADPAEESQK